uniref:Uncharacterized protein n=1 Tax=Tetranychus urticae TaxID=32264 RepID=T1KL85_TETUR
MQKEFPAFLEKFPGKLSNEQSYVLFKFIDPCYLSTGKGLIIS